MRRWLSFEVEGAACAATLDEGSGHHGLLIVSGGNEIRSGAHRGMARLAAAAAAAGHPVLRFDRRGIGDSEGENRGFESSGADIGAATAAFYAACPNLHSITAFGNCDAAAALLLHDPEPDGLDFLVLANPWTLDDAPSDSLPDAATIRARYRAKLRDPAEWRRAVAGGVDWRRFVRGLLKIALPRPAERADTSLAARIAAALHHTDDRSLTILLADGDRTAYAFSRLWESRTCDAVRGRPWIEVHRHPGGSHSFADGEARDWLIERVLAALAR